MSRKRTLYVSELLNRNTNKNIEYTIIKDNSRIGYHDKKDVIFYYKDLQVDEWYISEYYGIVIFIK